MITLRQWFAAVVTSLLLHLLALAGWPTMEMNKDNAQGHGKEGIEIGLGLLGDLGEAEKNSEQVQLPIASIPEKLQSVEPPAKNPEPEKSQRVEPPTIEPKLEPLPRKAELLVRTEPPQRLVKQNQPYSYSVEEQSFRQMQQNIRKPVSLSEKSTPSQLQRRKSAGRSSSHSAGGRPGVERSYAVLLATHLNRHRHYPLSSRRRGEEGVVRLHLEIERTGRVIEAHISKSSGSPTLNRAALQMVEKAKPFPAFPDRMPQPRITVSIPISFKLR